MSNDDRLSHRDVTTKPDQSRVDKILRALDQKPKVRDSLILALLIRGDVGRNIERLVHELGVKIATPWEIDMTDDSLHARRQRIGHYRPEGIAEVTVIQDFDGEIGYDWTIRASVLHESGSAEDMKEARDAADDALRKKGWILL